jgi:hypothetical protein
MKKNLSWVNLQVLRDVGETVQVCRIIDDFVIVIANAIHGSASVPRARVVSIIFL